MLLDMGNMGNLPIILMNYCRKIKKYNLIDYSYYSIISVGKSYVLNFYINFSYYFS